MLANRKAALQAMHLRPARSVEISGSISGGAITGAFRRWEMGDDAREDDEMGSHAVRTLRLKDRQYIINESGNVREIRGVLARRQRTDDFINSEDFVTNPQYDKLQGLVTLPGGRSAYQIDVGPPDGQPETVYLDAKTSMIDRLAYDEDDGRSTEDFFDYSVFRGFLLAAREVDSNGDVDFDLTHYTRHVAVDEPIQPAVFALPATSVIQTDKPITVPIREEQGHFFTQVRVGKKDYNFLIDTGAQMIALDTHVAEDQGLHYEGRLEVAGAKRIGGLGFAALDSVQIGGAVLPVRSVSVLDLRGAAGDADGVLGYPFFASAEVTIDPISRTMTIGKPGTLDAKGSEFPIDNDRQLVELHGLVNRVDGTFVVDTGNSTELLLYSPFMQAHPYVVPLEDRQRPANDYGVGGTTRASFGYVDELEFGPFHFYNRYANIIMSDRGAFADRFDAGNIGMGVLKNFVLTFDETNCKMYALKTAAFDDGRYRKRVEDPGVMFQ